MQTYFIDNEEFFRRKFMLYEKVGKFFPDNDERAIFYARGVIETVKNLGWSPDIIHCHGWISCLVPLFVKEIYKDNPLFANSKIVYSVYNDPFEKTLRSLSSKLKSSGIPTSAANLYKQATYNSTTKLAIDYSDAIIISQKDIGKETCSYIAESKKPHFLHTEEQYGEEYTSLYNSIM